MFHASPVNWLGLCALGFLAWMVFGGGHCRPRRWRWMPIVGVCLVGAWWISRDSHHDRWQHVERARRSEIERRLQQHVSSEIDQHIDRALTGTPGRLEQKGPNTTLELKIHVAASEEAGADAARWGAALWTLLDAAGQDPGPGQVDLRRLERIVVVAGDDRSWSIADLARLGRRTRRLPAESSSRVELTVRLDQADGHLNAEEIALELETHESDTKASERALVQVIAEDAKFDAVVEVPRLPKLAELPPLPPDAPAVAPDREVVEAETPAETPVPPATPVAPIPPVAPTPPVARVPTPTPGPPANLAQAIAAEVAKNVGEGLSEAAEAIAEAHADVAEARAEAAEAHAEAAEAIAEAHSDAARAVSEALDMASTDATSGDETPDPSAAPRDVERASRLAAAQLKVLTERPTWIDQPPGTHDGTFYLVQSAGPFSTREECEIRLPWLFEQMAERYSRMLQLDVSPRFDQLLDQGVCREAFIGPRETSLGAMYEVHALAAFDQRALSYLREAQRAGVVQQRMVVAGTVAAMCLGLLATLFGYLRLDTSTRGYYSGRLKLLAGTVAVFFVVAAVVVLGIVD